MATVNEQITDSVTQGHVGVLAAGPAQAAGNLQQAVAQSLALAAGNATTAQQQGTIIHQAATTVGVTALTSIATAATGSATEAAQGGAGGASTAGA